jgi:hypothetical protein
MHKPQSAPLGPKWAKLLVVGLASATVIVGGTAAVRALDAEANCFQLMLWEPEEYQAKCQLPTPPASLIEQGDEDHGPIDLTITITQTM